MKEDGPSFVLMDGSLLGERGSLELGSMVYFPDRKEFFDRSVAIDFIFSIPRLP